MLELVRKMLTSITSVSSAVNHDPYLASGELCLEDEMLGSVLRKDQAQGLRFGGVMVKPRCSITS